MKKTVLTYGPIAGVIIVLLMALFIGMMGKEQDYQMGEILGYASMIVALSTIFVGIRKYRDEELGGIITFGKAFQVGLLITLVASAIYVAAWMFYSAGGGADEMMTAYLDQMVEKMEADGSTQAEIDAKVNEMEQFQEMYKNPIVKIGITFLEIFPVGLIISLIAAGLLRKTEDKVAVAE